MKFKKKLLFTAAGLILIFVFAGCAGIAQKKSPILSFEINPQSGLKGGTAVTVTVRTTDDILKVSGTLDLPGAFEMPLRYNTDKKAWILKAMIPMMPIPEGEYTAVIKAVSRSGETFTAEKKVRTF